MSLWLTAIILGIVEGLTEFLPVSSTGHLILATELLGYDASKWAIFNIAIQPGAILAIVVLYRKLFWDMFVGFFRRGRHTQRTGDRLAEQGELRAELCDGFGRT